MGSILVLKPKYEIDECLAEIRECLELGWTGMGFKTLEFENKWKEYTKLPNAHYVNSSTMGLYLAIDILKEAYGWNDGDEIITTPNTFVSTNHAILKSGLKAVFSDIDDTMCLDPNLIESKITDKTRAVMYVGIGGNTGHYPEIVDICKTHGLKLILDAAHMAGARFDGVIPGQEAEVVVYSFQAVKNLPTADSGMICFNRADLDAIARKKSWLGISKDTYLRSSENNYKWEYSVDYVGEKGHGNSVIAAIGLVQLKYLDRDNEYRKQLADQYTKRLSDIEEIELVNIPDKCESSHHLYQILVEDRNGLMEHLNSYDINPGVHYISNTRYKMYSYAAGSCQRAEYVSDHVLSLPLNLYLSDSDVDRICDLVSDYVRRKNN